MRLGKMSQQADEVLGKLDASQLVKHLDGTYGSGPVAHNARTLYGILVAAILQRSERRKEERTRAEFHAICELLRMSSGDCMAESVFPKGGGSVATVRQIMATNDPSKSVRRLKQYEEQIRAEYRRQREERGGSDEEEVGDPWDPKALW